MTILRPILIIAKNTFREIIRDRILYGMVVFALLLIAFSMALGTLSFGEQRKISADFGFTAIHISSIILSIFVGSTLVSKEIEKKTILTLLARPISRLQFLLGKSLGLIYVISVVMFGLTCVLLLLFSQMGLGLNGLFLIGLWGIMLESLILLSLALLFSCLARPILVVSYSLGIFLIGHWVNDLVYFANKSSDQVLRFVGLKVSKLLPNLEYMNWRSLYVYEESIEAAVVLRVTAYSLIWAAIFLLLAVWLTRKRDFA
jgi:Cu-processing system permease protein